MKWKKQFQFSSLEQVKAWWQKRQPREQLLIGVCCAVLLGLGSHRLYAVYQEQLVNIENEILKSRSELLWVIEKEVDLRNIEKAGGAELNSTELPELIKTTLVSARLDRQTQFSQESDVIKLSWQGNNPSLFLSYLSKISIRGADIIDFSFTRKSTKTTIQVVIGG